MKRPLTFSWILHRKRADEKLNCKISRKKPRKMGLFCVYRFHGSNGTHLAPYRFSNAGHCLRLINAVGERK